jgi:hypothetical protein
MLNHAELPSSATAEDVLSHLRDSFLPIEDYNYQHDRPSHAWAKGAASSIDTKALHKLLMQLCTETERALKTEPMVLHFDSTPAYVMGDLHGNYKDLMNVRRSSVLSHSFSLLSTPPPPSLQTPSGSSVSSSVPRVWCASGTT